MLKFLQHLFFTCAMITMNNRFEMALILRDTRVWLPPIIILAASLAIFVMNGNSDLFLMTNSPHTFPGDRFWLYATVIGDSALLLVVLLPFVGRQPRILWHILIAAIFATVMVQLLKNGLGLPRPLSVLGDRVHVIGPELSRKSFPSGHSAAVFTLVSVFWLRSVTLFLTIPATLLAIIVAYSRLAVGAHWPLDIAGGMLIGWLAGVSAEFLGVKWDWGMSRKGQIFILIILFMAFLWVMLRSDPGHSPTQFMQYAIAISSLLASLPGIKLLLLTKEK